MTDQALHPWRKHAALATLALGLVVALVASDGDRTFEWVLARLLGLTLIYCGYAFFLWARGRSWWNQFFAGGFLADVGLRIADMTPFGYLPPLLLLIWMRGLLIPVVYAGGFREATKEKTKGELTKAMWASLGAGIVLHHVLLGPLVDTVLCLLTGKYP